jgi:maltodextrin utilization protein YvdJ
VLNSGAKGRPLNPLAIRKDIKEHLEPIEDIYSPKLDKFVDKVMKYKIKKSELTQKAKDKREQEEEKQSNSETNNKIKALRIKADIIELKEKLKNETSEAKKLRLQADIMEKEEELKTLE